MQAAPLVSVIIPAYNGEEYINEAIDSALEQQNVALEVIVVDDGSSDQTVKRVAQYGERVRLLQKKNGGVASARNVGVAHAKGRFVALLDQDDRYLPDKIAAQVSAMSEQPDAVLCHANIRMIDAQGSLMQGGHLGHPTDKAMPSGLVLKRLFHANFLLACTVLMRREAVLAVGGFNERLWGVDDYELWLKLAVLGPIVYLNRVVSEYRWHESNTSRDEFRMALGRLLAREEFLREMPQAWRILGSSTIRETIAKRAAEFAYPLYTGGYPSQARVLLRKGLRYLPLSRWLWKMYFASFLPRNRLLRSSGRP